MSNLDAIRATKDDVIDSRNVIERIEYLEALTTDDIIDPAEITELHALKALARQGENVDDWQYGATLVRDDYFVTYAKDFAADCGFELAPEGFTGWPLNHVVIDWDAAAEELRGDYTELTFDGVTYWTR